VLAKVIEDMKYVKALTTKTALELRKDDRRPMTEPSKTVKEFAPHAATCEVGVAHPSWTPDILTPADLNIPQVRQLLLCICWMYVLVHSLLNKRMYVWA
jgi:hypothetical protein